MVTPVIVAGKKSWARAPRVSPTHHCLRALEVLGFLIFSLDSFGPSFLPLFFSLRGGWRWGVVTLALLGE